jgi:hypothetical protein
MKYFSATLKATGDQVWGMWLDNVKGSANLPGRNGSTVVTKYQLEDIQPHQTARAAHSATENNQG